MTHFTGTLVSFPPRPSLRLTPTPDPHTPFTPFPNLPRHFQEWPNRPRAALEPFLLLLSPYAPHIAEELWGRCGNPNSLAYEPWPVCDESLLVQDTINLPVQVRSVGKYCDKCGDKCA